jgi:hypothetical protein
MKGGYLEPLIKIPEFKYTTDSTRIKLIQTLYPYVPYFLSMLNEIPWSKFIYDNDNYTIKCALYPYYVYGGAACECYKILFSQNCTNIKTKLYNLDPTGDIDIGLEKLVYFKKSNIININIETDKIYDIYIKWVIDHIYKYFNKISYNFNVWFPESLNIFYEDFYTEGDIKYYKDIGPFKICYINSEYTGYKIQILFNIIIDNIQHVTQFIEFMIIKDIIEEKNIKYKEIISMDNRLLLISPVNEFISNCNALIYRYPLKNTESHYKFYNHFMRTQLLFDIMECMNSPQIFSAIGIYNRIVIKHFIKVDKELAKELLNMVPESLTKYVIGYNSLKDKLNSKKKRKTLKGGNRDKNKYSQVM